MYNLTKQGKAKVQAFIAECQAKRKEILDAGKDTAREITRIVNERDVIGDINWRGFNEKGAYVLYTGWFRITDHHSIPLSLNRGEDICGDGPADMFK